jgi:hypothetical protein
MSSDSKKQNPTLESLIQNCKLLSGTKILKQKIEKESEAQRQSKWLVNNIEFEIRNREIRAS